METTLSTYLFRTICFKPKGLRVRLRVTTVSRTVVTFDEKEFPAATILPHGLFLAQPTPVGVKDPMLFAVLNQGTLNDDPHKAQFVVYSREEPQSDAEGPLSLDEGSMMENPLGKRTPPRDACRRPDSEKCTQLRLTLMRNGMVKELPNPVLLKHQSPINQKQFESEGPLSTIYSLHVCDWLDCGSINDQKELGNITPASRPYPITFSEIFVALMQFVVEKYYLHDLDAAADEGLSPPRESNPLDTQAENPYRSLNRYMLRIAAAFEWMIESHLLSLEQLSYWLPSQVDEDLNNHFSGWHETHQQLQALISACLELLLRPVAKSMDDMHPGKPSEDQKVKDYTKKRILDCINIFERVEFSNTADIELFQMIRKFRSFMPVTSAALEMAACWSSVELRRNISSRIVNCLSKFQVPKLAHQAVLYVLGERTVVPYERSSWLKNSIFANNFTTIEDKFLAGQSIFSTCQSLSARSTTKINLRLTLDGTLKIRAIILYHQTTICFLSVQTEDTNPINQRNSVFQSIKIKTYVKLFRKGVEIATYGLGYCFGHALRYQNEEATHRFTGRYLIHIICKESSKVYKLRCFDLAPCLQHQPEPLVVSVQPFSQLAGSDSIKYHSLSFTDHFLAFLQVSVAQNQSSKVERAVFCIQAYENIKENIDPLRISVKGAFQKIMDVIGGLTHKSGGSRFEALCWTRKQRLAFYTNWTYHRDIEERNTILIVCFDVKIHLQSAKLVTFAFSHQKELQTEQFYGDYEPKFHTIHTQVRDYLVMDILVPDDGMLSMGTAAAILLGRILFTIHKNKIHRVAVNGQPAWKFPSSIGPRIKYAGYHSQITADFHHRRVFSSDKVVSAIYRLDFKPL